MSRLRALVLYAQGAHTTTLSYYYGWPRHIDAHPAFDVRLINLLDRGDRARLALAPARVDVVLLLHSAFSNEPYLRGWLLERVRRIRATKAYFVGNEYKLMPEKIAFAERLDVKLLVSQLDDPRSHDLYRQRLGCEVLYVPCTGLDPELFHPGPARAERPIDLGYRAFDSPPHLGHDERRRLAEEAAPRAAARGLVVDAALGRERRLGEAEWARFLHRCKGQFGSEAGGDWFELTDARRRAHMEATPDILAEINDRLFSDPPQASGRAISGRVVEAAGTKTVQLLLEGRYGGFFKPNEHYIPIRRDLSDLDRALDLFEDESHCRRLVEAAHEQALAELTYPRLIGRIHDALERVI